MCGIIGFIGIQNENRRVPQVLLKGIQKLEYRGYDSSGMCFMDHYESSHNEKKVLIRASGPIVNLETKLGKEGYLLPKETFEKGLGIAHTRWATHGEPLEKNAHPHMSQNKEIAVVHNGIIENKDELKKFLQEKGFEFLSETDTEVIPMLIEYEMKSEKGNMQNVMKRVVDQLKGAYGIAFMCGNDLFAFRLGSPLCIGLGKEGFYFVASEPSAFLEYTTLKIELEDYDFVHLTNDGFSIFNLKTMQWRKDIVPEKVPFHLEQVKKGEYPHFMLKEIHEQNVAVQRTVASKLLSPSFANMDMNVPQNLSSITFLACGTSLHATMIGSYIIEKINRITVRCEYASEYMGKPCLLNPKTDMVVAVSQSGETADTREALKRVKEHGVSVAGIVNVIGSQIARLASRGMYLHAGPEIGVASTKAFTCQVAAMNLFAGHLAALDKNEKDEEMIRQGLQALPEVIAQLLNDQVWKDRVKQIAETVFHPTLSSALFMGRGIDFPVALEGALKLKEISYIHAEAYPSGEMKHGPIALISEAMPVVFLLGHENFEKVMSNMEEVKARKGKIVCVTDIPFSNELSEQYQTIFVPHINPLVAPILKVLPLQLFAYHAAVIRGLDPDKPRNLAKSVTVL